MKNMKPIKLYFLIILIMINIVYSCKKIQEEGNIDEFGEIVYTDSFSPREWENPLGRIKVEAVDKDIGKFINADTIDPRLRKILDIVDKFVFYIKNNRINEIYTILTPSAKNSFILRYKKVKINKKYIIRVSYPENIENKTMWLDFKIIYPNASIVSKIEFEYLNDNYVISDFADKFFDDFERMLSK